MRYPGMTVEGGTLSLFFVLLFYTISWIVVKRRYNDPHIRRFFFQGLTLKFIGGFAFALVYQFYYGGGDTFRYFANAATLVDFFFDQPGKYFVYLTETSLDQQQIEQLNGVVNMMTSPNSFVTVRIASFIGIFTGHHYLVTTFFFAFLSYIGVWGLYRTCCRLFPLYQKLLTLPILFFPSFLFWGSSIMKDSVVVGFLGLLVYLSYRVLLLKEFRLSFLILFGSCFYILFNVKIYVILSFLPAAFLWVVFANSNRITNTRIRLLAKPVALGTIIIGISIGLPLASSYSDRYDIQNALATAETTASYIYRVTEIQGGAAYKLNIEYTPVGLLMAAPAAVNVTLFRPYLWEVRNPVMLLAALEGTLLLIFTLYLFFKVGVWKFYRFVASRPFLVASLTFSIVFAFAVGASTFNFGSLVRYKIPCLPFYGLVLAITYGNFQHSRRATARG